MITEPKRPEPTPESSKTGWAWLIAGIGLGAVVLACLHAWLRPTATPLQQVQTQYVSDIARLNSAARQLQRAINTNRPLAEWQALFRKTRLAYKRVEFLTELYTPETAKSINGPNVAEVDEADKKVESPEGLQVLEDMLFPYDPTQLAETIQQVAVLVSNVGRLSRVAAVNEMTDSHVFDAMRLEMFRLVSLGITGFDSPIVHQSLPEAVVVLQSLRQYLSFYALIDINPNLGGQLDTAFVNAIGALRKEPDFNRFDRLDFITHQANVLSVLLLDVQNALAIPVFRESRFLSPAARTLNDPNAFDAGFFVNTTDDRPTPARTALGNMLFYDPILSGSPGRTCATCHQPDRAFSDGEPTSLAVGGAAGQRIARNAPTLMNAAFQAVQFMDSRVVFLEDQASDVIRNTAEMHGSLPVAVRALQQRADYRRQFAKAYTDGITEHTLQNALASYVRSLTSLDSRVDRYLRGQPAQLTDEEKQGFNLFMGKAQCATCHFFPLFNGTVPPGYSKTESEVLGIPATAANRSLDSDPGKFLTTDIPIQKHAFKTPTVRFAAKTAPYMHNGVYRTLEQVVDFYNRGGGNGLGFNLPNQTLVADELHLTRPEQQALVVFMKAL